MNTYLLEFYSYSPQEKATMYNVINEVAEGQFIDLGKKFLTKEDKSNCHINVILFRSKLSFKEIRTEYLIGSDEREQFHIFIQISKETFRIWHPDQNLSIAASEFFSGDIKDDEFFSDVKDLPRCIEGLRNAK